MVGNCRLLTSGACIALEFARYGGAMSAKLCSDTAKVDVLAFEGVNLVSFFLGQVFVVRGVP